jgi:hypothetical protein
MTNCREVSDGRTAARPWKRGPYRTPAEDDDNKLSGSHVTFTCNLHTFDAVLCMECVVVVSKSND